MMMSAPDWQALNAYVDGELAAPKAASVAEAVGEDPAVERQVDALYRLKGATQGAFPTAPEGLVGAPSRTECHRRAPLRSTVTALAIAATLAALWFGLRPEPSTLPVGLLETARGLHAEWLDSSGDDAANPPATLIAALAHFRQLPAIPDLESARLTVVRVRFAERPNGPVLQVGYLGRHGCHLSLFVFSDASLPEIMVRSNSGPERAYGWRANDLGYLLFARGMDGDMLDLIARTVEQQTRTRAPFDGDTREALADQKRNSSSCTA